MTCTTARNHAIRSDYATTMSDLYRNADEHARLLERVEFHVDIVALLVAAGGAFVLGYALGWGRALEALL